jgi:hypothetical protein
MPVPPKYQLDLANFQSAFDRLFCDIAAFLGNFGNDVDRLLGEIESFITKDQERLVATAVHGSREMASDYRDEATLFMRLTAGFVAHTDILMDSIARMASTLKHIGEISKRVRLVGLNALTAATRLGNEGAALSVLAQNLTELAQSDGVVAARLCALADSLGTHIQEVADSRSRMESLSREGLTESDLPVDKLHATVESIVAELAAIAATARRLRATMADVMVGLQRQDILRQGMDHVRLVLEAIFQEYSLLPQLIDPADGVQREQAAMYLLFQERAAALAAALLGESRAELRSLVNETRAGVDGMAEALQLLSGVREKVEVGLRSQLREPAAVLERLGCSLEEQVKESFHLRDVVQGVASLAECLQPDFTCLYEIRIHLRAVRVLTRTESALTTVASGTASSVADIEKGEDALGGFLDATHKEANLLVGALRSITEVSDRVHGHRERLAVMAGRLRECPKAILHAGTEFGRRFEGVARKSDTMQKTLRAVGADLANFQSRLSILSDLQQVCEELARSAGQLRAERLGADVPDEPLPTGRLSEIIDHFTTFSHKQIGSELAGVEVANGDAGGTLTLF